MAVTIPGVDGAKSSQPSKQPSAKSKESEEHKSEAVRENVAKLKVLSPPRFFFFSGKINVFLDDKMIGVGSARKGIEITVETSPGRHILALHILGGIRKKDYAIDLSSPGRYEVHLTYSRFWGNFMDDFELVFFPTESAASPHLPSDDEVYMEVHNLGLPLFLGTLREKSEQAIPDAATAADSSEIEWYAMESASKMCKQIVLAEKNVSLCKSPIGGPFIYGPLQRARAWGMGTVFSGNVAYLCVKCVGVEEAIKNVPCRLAFAFYRFPEAGLFQPLLVIQHDNRKPFIVENPWNLRATDMLRGARDLLSRPYLVLQFFDANMLGIHARVIRPPEDCMASIKSLFEEASDFDKTIRNPDFRAAENRYYQMNPADESPILENKTGK